MDRNRLILRLLSSFRITPLNVGDIVKPESVIGKIGSTGHSTGPHLHWGFWSIENEYVSPTTMAILFGKEWNTKDNTLISTGWYDDNQSFYPENNYTEERKFDKEHRVAYKPELFFSEFLEKPILTKEELLEEKELLK